MPQCRSCGSFIEWVKTAKGKNMPIDEEAVEPGECEPRDVIVNSEGHVCQARNADPDYSGTWHLSHFATCPNADEHRGRR